MWREGRGRGGGLQEWEGRAHRMPAVKVLFTDPSDGGRLHSSDTESPRRGSQQRPAGHTYGAASACGASRSLHGHEALGRPSRDSEGREA